MKKLRWPKFLTIKRTILIVLLVLIASLLLYYFLGGVKESKLESNTRPFVDGLNAAYEKDDDNEQADLLLQSANFKSYSNYIDSQTEARKESLTAAKNVIISNINALNLTNFEANIDSVVDSLTTLEVKLALDAKLTSLASEAMYAGENALMVTINQVKSALNKNSYPNDQQYLLGILKEEYVLILQNSNFKFYFNYIDTTFKIEGLDKNGNVVTEWYSNPQNDGNDPNTNNQSTIYKQMSPIIVKYFTPSGALIEYTAYEYSIKDDNGTPESPEPVTPDFWFKVDEANQSIQVYYRLAKRGLNFSDFPKILTDDRLDELIERNLTNVNEALDDIEELYEDEEYDDLYEKYLKEKLDTTDTDNQLIPYYINYDKKVGIATLGYLTYLIKQMNDLDDLEELANAVIDKNADKYGNSVAAKNEAKDQLAKQINRIKTTSEEVIALSEEKGISLEEAVHVLKVERYISNILSQRQCIIPAYNAVNGTDITDATIKNIIEEIYEGGSYAVLKEVAREVFLVEHEFTSSDLSFLKTLYKEEGATDENGNKLLDEEGFQKSNYVISNYDKKMTKATKYQLQQLFYRLDYSTDDLRQDLSDHNIDIEVIEAEFAVGVEYKLTENGLTTTIINESIYESDTEEYPIYAIDLLPYFASVNCEVNGMETNGEMIVPDGSGAVINLNNGKVGDVQYSKRVYSSDLVFPTEIKSIVTQDILLPFLAISKDKTISGLGTDVSNSAFTMLLRGTTGASQLIANATISKFADSYNKVYFTATYRESQVVEIGTGYYASNVTRKTENITAVDCSVDYYLYSQENLTYSELAKEYQDILLSEGVLSETNKDTTKQTVLNAEYLGIYDYKTNFLGIVYDAYDTLTTYEQALKITQDLKSWGANTINVQYLGWRDGGLVKETFNDMSFGNKLGSKDERLELIKYFDENETTLYPMVSFLEINKYEQLFGRSKYSARDVSSEFAEKYPYDLAGNIYDKTQRAIYMLSPKYFESFATTLAENFKDKNPELSSMAFEQLGSKIVGDYERRHECFRYSSVVQQQKVFDILAKNEITDLSLTAPYEFAIPYASNITELPYEATQYSLFDYSIPFYQLVVSGYKDYSGTIINANDEQGLNHHIMNILETGSNIQFTFSYDSSDKLIQTDYNYYYYTQYSDWKDEVTKTLNILDKIKLHEYVLDSHELFNGQLDVFKVVYSNGTDSFSIILNYTDKQITLGGEYTIININSNEPFSAKSSTLAPWTCAISKEVQ